MTSSLKQIALRTIELESQSISGLSQYINADFEKAVNAITDCKGRLVISGIGKSAVIAQKIVATLNSTGTPSIFMHAADAIHGDLGIVQQDDVVMIISKSGESPEIKVLVPLIKNFKNILIGMVGSVESYLASQADIILNTTVSQEACPNNLAPTSSTTAQLVMGDALAICLMEMKGFNSDDFAKFHPGGTLAKDRSLKEVIVEISSKRLGATAVVDSKDNLLGIITDGDLRRMLEKNISLDSVTAADIMTATPKSISADELAVDALDLMRKSSISQLVVVEKARPPARTGTD